jgi:hypothetical protein
MHDLHISNNANYDVNEMEPLLPLQLRQYKWSQHRNHILAIPMAEEAQTAETFIILQQESEIKPASIVEVGRDPKIRPFLRLIQSRPIFFETRHLKIPLLENDKTKRKLIKRRRDRVQVAAHQLANLLLSKNNYHHLRRLERLVEEQGTVAHLLQGTTWRQILRTDNILLPYQTFFWYRASVGRLSFFNTATKVPNGGCHICPDEKESTEHLFWDCELAQKVWQRLLQEWTGTKTSRRQLATNKPNIFQRRPPVEALRYRYASLIDQGASMEEIVTAWTKPGLFSRPPWRPISGQSAMTEYTTTSNNR